MLEIPVRCPAESARRGRPRRRPPRRRPRVLPVDVARVVAAEHAQKDARLDLGDDHLDALLDIPLKKGGGRVLLETKGGEGRAEVGARGLDAALGDVLVGGGVVVPLESLLDPLCSVEAIEDRWSSS